MENSLKEKIFFQASFHVWVFGVNILHIFVARIYYILELK